MGTCKALFQLRRECPMSTQRMPRVDRSSVIPDWWSCGRTFTANNPDIPRIPGWLGVMFRFTRGGAHRHSIAAALVCITTIGIMSSHHSGAPRHYRLSGGYPWT